MAILSEILEACRDENILHVESIQLKIAVKRNKNAWTGICAIGRHVLA